MSILLSCSQKLIFVSQGPRKLVVLNPDNSIISSIDFDADITSIAAAETQIAVGLRDKSLNIFHIADGVKFELKEKIITGRVAEQLSFADYDGKPSILMNDGSDIVMYDLANLKQPKILMGHIATTTYFTLNPEGSKLATCDRDGRIRISKYPKAYDILKFCLYHEEVVTSLLYIQGTGELLSADSDGQIAKWDSNGNFIISKYVFPKNSFIIGMASIGDNVAVICEKCSKICIINSKTLETVTIIDTPEITLSIASFNQSSLYVGCNGVLVVINKELETFIIDSIDAKLETIPSKEKMRVAKKNIIHKDEKSGEAYTLWRSPETAPPRED